MTCATAAPSTSSTSSAMSANCRRPPPSKPWSRLPRPHGRRARRSRPRPARRAQPQHGNRAPPLQAGPPGADYAHSLEFLKQFKARYPDVKTKSGLMVGLGETDEEILDVMRDLRAHDVEMLTIGQYLAPSGHHLPVRPLRSSRHLQDVRRRSEENGLLRCCLCPDGALQLLGRPAGPQRRHRLINSKDKCY